MDTKLFIEKLNTFFYENNRNHKRYSQAWLSNVDFGGLYENGMYVLSVKTAYHINSCNKEIGDIITLVHEKAPAEFKLIWRVVVYNADENNQCGNDDLLVFDETALA